MAPGVLGWEDVTAVLHRPSNLDEVPLEVDIAPLEDYGGPCRRSLAVRPIGRPEVGQRPALTVDREVPRISPTTHSREQGIRVHYLANLGGPVAVAGLDHQEPDEPDLLLGILLEVGKMRTWTLAQCDSGEPGTHPRPPSSECCILAWPLRAVRRRRDDGASVSVSNPLPPLRCSATIDEVVVRPCLDFPCRNARSCA